MEHVSLNGAPSRALLFTEPTRATAEFGSFLLSALLLRRAPRGDGHTVLVLPGFLADDRSTMVLRGYLSTLGYKTSAWGLGRNIGPTPGILKGMEQRLLQLADRAGSPISIVGWSLGGMFARALGRDHPEHIRQIVTLGSPFRSDAPIGSHATRSFERLAHIHVPFAELPAAETDQDQLKVPVAAVYTKGDGVVAWQSCLQEEGHQRENIEVLGSHCGLGHNPMATWVVADRLAQPIGAWSPFKPPAFARRLYRAPSSATWLSGQAPARRSATPFSIPRQSTSTSGAAS
jgi:pimeloyl-ACP methyl ester carboxylesterase